MTLNKRQRIEKTYNWIGTIFHGLKQNTPLPALKDDLDAMLLIFPDDLTILDELVSLKRKPSNQWPVVLFAALDQMLVKTPPISSMRINGDVVDYLHARRNGDWANIKKIRDSFCV